MSSTTLSLSGVSIFSPCTVQVTILIKNSSPSMVRRQTLRSCKESTQTLQGSYSCEEPAVFFGGHSTVGSSPKPSYDIPLAESTFKRVPTCRGTQTRILPTKLHTRVVRSEKGGIPSLAQQKRRTLFVNGVRTSLELDAFM